MKINERLASVNYIAPTAAINHIDITFLCQSIVKRNHALFGSEILTKIDNLYDDTLEQCYTNLSNNQLQIINSETLTKVQLMTVASSSRPFATPPSRQFVKVAQATLLDHGLIEEIIQASNTLKANNQQLVIEITARLPNQYNHLKKKCIAQHVYLLKDHNIEIALDDYERSTYHLEPLIKMNLCDYIKIDVQKNGIISSARNAANAYNTVYDNMNSLIHEQGVCFIAKQVETKRHFDIVKNMPFTLFQGLYISSAEEI